MKKLFNFLLLAVASSTACAGDGVAYSVSSIPATLIINANVVKRYEEVRFEVKSPTETVLYRKYALTILNEKGDEQAGMVQGYDKLIKVISFEGSLYDAEGRQIKKLKNKDIQDVSAVQDISLIDDNRVKSHNFYHKQYPYTVEYEVEIKFNHTFYFPKWMPRNYTSMSVEKSVFTVVVPASYPFRHRSFNYTGAPTVVTDKNRLSTTWQAAAMPAIQGEVATPVWSELTTVVYTAPTAFEMEGYKGNMSTWQDFGKFAWELNKGRDVLPENIVQTVKSLTQNVKEEKEKVKVLYEYLQKSTRYISIQLGIGGLQPFPAADVASKGYGDCKALTNYMYSLLKAAGVRSHYALVNSDRSLNDRFIIEDFAYDPFDHVILCVPLLKDTVWLECTSQTTPAGYMGGFTGNRKALLVSENGGTLVNTPQYGMADNLQLRTIKGAIDGSGNLKATVHTLYTGLQQDYLQSMLHHTSKDAQQEALNEKFDLSTYTVNQFTYDEKRSALPQLTENLDVTVSSYATMSGKRLFVVPNLINRSTMRLEDEKRMYDFQFGTPFKDADTVEIELPQGYVLETAPAAVELKTKYGHYSSRTELKENKMIYYRLLEQPAGKYAAAEAAELSKFFAAIYKADRARVVLVKKDL